MFVAIMPELAAGRRVITVDLQGHGRTADVDRPFRPGGMADDVAALAAHLGLAQIDVMGYSLGGAVALRTGDPASRARAPAGAGRDPVPARRQPPRGRAAMEEMTPEIAEVMKQSPPYALYSSIAPRPEDWPVLIAKTSDALKVDYDWTAETAALTAPTMLVFADADSVRPAHIVEFYGLLGGGLRDAGWDNSNRPIARLAILPGTTHYDVFMSPLLAPAVIPFLDAPA